MHGDKRMNIERRVGVTDSRMIKLKEIQKRQSGSVSDIDFWMFDISNSKPIFLIYMRIYFREF